MKIGAILQARMSSTRFPQKTLHEINGKPLLGYLLERLQHCVTLERIIVATSTDDTDTPIEKFCRKNNVEVFRGDLQNVAKRFLQVVDAYQLDAFIRVNGDSPLLDQGLIARALEIFQKGDLDLVTNINPRTFPNGASVEIVKASAFRKAFALMTTPEEFEHATRYFYDHQHDFKIANFTADRAYPGLKLAVDTPEDMDNFAKIVANMTRPHWEYTLAELAELAKEPVK